VLLKQHDQTPLTSNSWSIRTSTLVWLSIWE